MVLVSEGASVKGAIPFQELSGRNDEAMPLVGISALTLLVA